MAEVVAYEMGLTVSDAIRSLIRSAHREVERRAVMAEIAVPKKRKARR